MNIAKTEMRRPHGSRSERRDRRKRSAVRGPRQGRARRRLPRRSLSSALRDTSLVRFSARCSEDAFASLSVALLETALRPAAALGCHRRQRKLHRHENGKCSERVFDHETSSNSVPTGPVSKSRISASHASIRDTLANPYLPTGLAHCVKHPLHDRL